MAKKVLGIDQRSALALVIIALGLLAFSFYYPKVATAPNLPSSESSKKSLGTFTGTLPCADCSGLKTTLTLYESASGGAAGYKLTEEYMGKTKPATTSGNWDFIRGTNVDPNATVYLLNPDSKTDKQYYQKIDENTLRMLDASGNPYEAPFNLNLTRVK